MSLHVLSVSSGRADVGILTPVWQAVARRADMRLSVFLTGMHMADGAPEIAGLPPDITLRRGGRDLGGSAGADAAAAMAEIARAAGDLYDTLSPDLVLVIGDRLDMLPAATASLPFNLPLAHLHGGEVTEGAIDDRVRHVLTKMAHIHCASSAGARKRLLALGEEDWRIRVTGAPGLDTLLAAPEIDRSTFCAELGLPADEPFRLVTVHPETNAPDPLAPLDAVLDALDSLPAPTLITAPNSDPGGAEAKARIDRFAADRPWLHLVDTLGGRLYPNALRHAALMLGNSSSGVIEAGLFGLPVIDVGDRQKGRERGANVTPVASHPAAVLETLRRVGPSPSRFAPGTPYGDGRSGSRIAEALAELAAMPALMRKAAPGELEHAA